jgi:choline transport protein
MLDSSQPDGAIELQPPKSGAAVSVEPVGKLSGNDSLYHQTRTRRLFSFSQLFAFSLTYMALWEGMCTFVTSPLTPPTPLLEQNVIL